MDGHVPGPRECGALGVGGQVAVGLAVDGQRDAAHGDQGAQQADDPGAAPQDFAESVQHEA